MWGVVRMAGWRCEIVVEAKIRVTQAFLPVHGRFDTDKNVCFTNIHTGSGVFRRNKTVAHRVFRHHAGLGKLQQIIRSAGLAAYAA